MTVQLRHLLRALLVFAVLATGGCGAGQNTVWNEPPASEAEAAYRDALESMEDGNLIEATKAFNQLRLQYPFSSRWTNLSELRLADIALEQARYGAAAEGYALFVKSHPTHEDVPYALYKVGICYYEQMPSTFFIMPDPWQRELNSARQADSSLRRFLDRYPDSLHVGDAREKLSEVRDRLAHHELYVAEFYIGRESTVGATNRLLTLVHKYPDTSFVDAALFLLARVYIEQKDVNAAAAALTRLSQDYPGSDYREDADSWLSRHGMTDVAPMEIGLNAPKSLGNPS